MTSARRPQAPDFEPSALTDFLGSTFGSRKEFLLERAGGGQSNPTYFLTYGRERMVLRKKPSGPTLPGAHAIEREFRVLGALHPAGIPVPRPILLHEDAELLGTPFYLMERVDGRVFEDCALSEVSVDERRSVYLAMAQTLASLHAISPEAVGLGDFGRPGNYFERQFRRWGRQWRESPSERIGELDELSAWLSENMPADDGAISIAHGDFRLGNLLFHLTQPRVAAILDWELSTLGHPLADLGFCCLPWHTAPDEYGGILGLDLAELGLPREAEFLARYYTEAGSAPELRPFHIAFALFRFAVIFVGISDRARAGSAAGANATQLAPLARHFARRALDVIERSASFEIC